MILTSVIGIHILLRLQIFVGVLILIMGFQIVSYTLPRLEEGKITAGVGYLICGLLTVFSGILLISGIGIMYGYPLAGN
tara:strand:- start:255 stop:491 length:237 start_codon:yes stop_codon:yes gene_type:complete